MNSILLFCLAVIFINCFTIKERMYHDDAQFEAIPKNNYPVRLAFVNRISYWYGDNIAKSLGVPGFAEPHIFNYIVITFWGCGSVKDVAMLWRDAKLYFGDMTTLGKTTQQIQKNMKKRYNDAGIKVLVSAFGDSQFPTSSGYDPAQCGKRFGQFILNNNFDGGDIDWQDNTAMRKGTGEDWLIKFTQAVRQVIPNHILTHSPQAPYFKSQYYVNQAYVKVHKTVGSLINFYNVQFYNQVDSTYDTYQQLFVHATGSQFNNTSVYQIIKRGVPSNKVVVAKPVRKQDASNTGWMDINKLGDAVSKAYEDYTWYAGVAFWQYFSDSTGVQIKKAAGHLVELCATNKNCK